MRSRRTHEPLVRAEPHQVVAIARCRRIRLLWWLATNHAFHRRNKRGVAQIPTHVDQFEERPLDETKRLRCARLMFFQQTIHTYERRLLPYALPDCAIHDRLVASVFIPHVDVLLRCRRTPSW